MSWPFWSLVHWLPLAIETCTGHSWQSQGVLCEHLFQYNSTGLNVLEGRWECLSEVTTIAVCRASQTHGTEIILIHWWPAFALGYWRHAIDILSVIIKQTGCNSLLLIEIRQKQYESERKHSSVILERHWPLRIVVLWHEGPIVRVMLFHHLLALIRIERNRVQDKGNEREAERVSELKKKKWATRGKKSFLLCQVN